MSRAGLRAFPTFDVCRQKLTQPHHLDDGNTTTPIYWGPALKDDDTARELLQ